MTVIRCNIEIHRLGRVLVRLRLLLARAQRQEGVQRVVITEAVLLVGKEDILSTATTAVAQRLRCGPMTCPSRIIPKEEED